MAGSLLLGPAMQADTTHQHFGFGMDEICFPLLPGASYRQWHSIQLVQGLQRCRRVMPCGPQMSARQWQFETCPRHEKREQTEWM
jgi:hypothetical protein